MGAAVGLAGPAAAIDDATHPDARVTHGPSCRPGGLVVEVVAGTVPYAVRLTTTRSADAEDEALLQPGQAVELRTGDVAPGETIDARLEYAAQDGSGTTFADDLADWTLARPTVEDCDAATAPPPSSPTSSPTPTPTPSPTPSPTPTTEPEPTPEPGTPSPQPPDQPSSSPAPTTTAPSSPVPSATPSPTPRPSSTPSAPSSPRSTAPSAAPSTGGTAVSAGGTVRIRVEGYRAGERVAIALGGGGEVIGSAWAADDGSVTAEVRIPAETGTGPAALHVVGGDPGAVAAVPLEVAAAATDDGPGGSSSLPLLLAAGALSATGAAVVSATPRRRPGR
jgi:hypothetical protein